jgi:RNA-directed DNA polymerase
VDELARRLGLSVESLESIRPCYREFNVAKRSGGVRRIAAPADELKELQRRILRRLLARLKVHSCAIGFRRGESFVTNARRHVGKQIVIHFDIKEFFHSISAKRVRRYFRAIGWNRPASRLLVRLVTVDGRLPQGAPTSPHLSNLVNHRLDARLAGLANEYDAIYTRYADDIVISLDDVQQDLHPIIAAVISILHCEGYRPHLRKKFDVRRQHQRQEVTGLVVNTRANLPRTTRRWLRAVEHRTRQWDTRYDASSLAGGAIARQPTLSKKQLAGWRALVRMVELQTEAKLD